MQLRRAWPHDAIRALHDTGLFGVYGMLGVGLMLFCLRGLRLTGAARRPMLAIVM